MRLYNHASDFPAYENRARKNRPLQLVGDQFEPNHPRTGLSDPWSWRESFENWLREQDVEITPEEPVHVRIGQPASIRALIGNFQKIINGNRNSKI